MVNISALSYFAQTMDKILLRCASAGQRLVRTSSEKNGAFRKVWCGQTANKKSRKKRKDIFEYYVFFCLIWRINKFNK